MHSISFFMAFTAGLFSFISPCVLPVVPSYLCYITGLSFEDLTAGSRSSQSIKWLTIKNSLMFIAGFSIIFILFGATATSLGQLLHTYQAMVRKIGGAIVILLGLYIMGILKFGFLMTDKRTHIQNKPAGLIGSFLVGIAFASGWTPCVGPILGSILLYASTEDSVLNGVTLLSAYSLGIGLPLFILSLGFNSFLSTYKKIIPYMKYINVASGLFIIFIGILIFTNSLTILTSMLTKYHIGWTPGT
ncbi:MAG: sulfite exporter TauE/SafE family protein [Nitrospirae bacterium]|nr:sulfite exporter TauE/SafE family protein [Nitrospirota bacterium]MBI3353156.1 sulfite exporter TauE/SafE family protein [Nitrospirota bacterium]